MLQIYFPIYCSYLQFFHCIEDFNFYPVGPLNLFFMVFGFGVCLFLWWVYIYLMTFVFSLLRLFMAFMFKLDSNPLGIYFGLRSDLRIQLIFFSFLRPPLAPRLYLVGWSLKEAGHGVWGGWSQGEAQGHSRQGFCHQRLPGLRAGPSGQFCGGVRVAWGSRSGPLFPKPSTETL